MRELKYFVACTADRFIARVDGSFDFFLFDGPHVAELLEEFPETIPAHLQGALGVTPGNKWFDAVLMGRRTYEVGVREGVTSPYPQLRQYVFSHTMGRSLDDAVELVSGDALSFVRELKRQPGKDIWLCGGADLAADLFGEIDEVILKVHPIFLGAGIPLFSRQIDLTYLTLTDAKTYSNGFMRIRYRT